MAIPEEILSRVQNYTKSTPQRMISMYDALVTIDSENIVGDVVECGVWRGGNIMMARIMSPSRVCWLYDTFDGMTEPHHEFDTKRPRLDGQPGEKAIDRYRLKINGGIKWDAVQLEDVEKYFTDLGLRENCFMIKGPIEETIHDNKPAQIALLRLDLDWYIPTKVALEHLYSRVVRGGFLIIDDYGHWMGCKKAVDDYFGSMMPEIIWADYSCVSMRRWW